MTLVSKSADLSYFRVVVGWNSIPNGKIDRFFSEIIRGIRSLHKNHACF